MALVDDIKTQLRVTTDDFNSEISGLIEAAKTDMKTAGVANPDESDPLVKQCVILYCKANFGYDNPEAERFMSVYEDIKNKLTMLSEYNSAGG